MTEPTAKFVVAQKIMTRCLDLNQLIGNVPKLTAIATTSAMDAGKADAFFDDLRVYASKETPFDANYPERLRSARRPDRPGQARRRCSSPRHASAARRRSARAQVTCVSCAFSQAKNSAYQSRELRGFRIQWFSSGNQSRRASTPRAFSVL